MELQQVGRTDGDVYSTLLTESLPQLAVAESFFTSGSQAFPDKLPVSVLDKLWARTKRSELVGPRASSMFDDSDTRSPRETELQDLPFLTLARFVSRAVGVRATTRKILL